MKVFTLLQGYVIVAVIMIMMMGMMVLLSRGNICIVFLGLLFTFIFLILVS